MSFGIAKTIPAPRGIERVDALCAGTLKEREFHMAGKPCTLVMVEAPGERLEGPMPRRGHRGRRYFSGDKWPESCLRSCLLPGYTDKNFSPLLCRF